MVSVPLNMKKGRINLVSRIEKNWGQLPNGDVAERRSEGLALAFVGVPFGRQDSISKLQGATTVDVASVA